MVERTTPKGRRYWVSEPVEQQMPRIDDQFLDCSIYLYPTVENAKRGDAIGGTGFIVGVPYRRANGYTHRYAVTCSHVIRRGRAPVVRVNTRDGEFDVLDLAPDQWIHHPDGHDIAVCPVSLPANDFKYTWLPPELFVTKKLIEEEDIGPGDEAFFVGRFITHEGRQRNLPTARFGNISMMPWEKVTNRMGLDQESFLVEGRSRPCYSGLPLFVFLSAFAKRPG